MLNATIKTRVLVVNITLLIFLVGLSSFAVFQLHKQNQAAKEIGEIWLPLVGKAAELNINLTNIRRLEWALISMTTTDEQQKVVDEMDSLIGNITIYSGVLEPLATTPSLKSQYEKFMSALETYKTELETLKELSSKNDKIKFLNVVQTSSLKAFEDASSALKVLTDESYMAGVKNTEQTAADYKISFMALISSVSILSIFALLLSIWNIRKIQNSLVSIAEGLEKSSGTIKNGSTQNMEMSDNISQSAAQTAASLEEMVATMEELSAMVKLNSSNSIKAADLSREGQNTIETGQTQIRNLIDVMDKVSASSKKIHEITNLIDDIAFQTNLLALNASVEAARAGEQGRGFAVVADAVRGLAQKSAEAAKEITALIEESSQHTEQGVQLANISGKALDEIVKNSSNASTLIQEVSQGSSEQSHGIEQAKLALTQIDQSLQSIVASMQTVTGSSRDLSDEALKLNEMMTKLGSVIGRKEQQLKNAELSAKENSH